MVLCCGGRRLRLLCAALVYVSNPKRLKGHASECTASLIKLPGTSKSVKDKQ